MAPVLEAPLPRRPSIVMRFLPPCLRADTYDQSGLQEVQLEDGSTAYIQHTVHMPQSNTILAIQADGTIADLQAEATSLDPETISVLEQYTTKVKPRPRWVSVVWRACHATQNQDQGVHMFAYVCVSSSSVNLGVCS